VEGHSDPNVSVGERLREIGKKLNVSRIEAGAVRSDGFLKRMPDGSYAVYYSCDCSLAKRRFTVAHELAHLVLEKFHKHVGPENPDSRADGHHPAVERAVDQIAAELLMPESLVVGLMTVQCQIQREQSDLGMVQKREVVQVVGDKLGVSEYALVLRLLELPTLLSVLLRIRWKKNKGLDRASYFPIKFSEHSYLRIVDFPVPDVSNIEEEDGWEHQVQVQTKWGLRVIHCHGWRRHASCTEPGAVESWILGWTWNAFPLPAWDDSEHKGGTPNVIRVREFEESLARAEKGAKRRR